MYVILSIMQCVMATLSQTLQPLLMREPDVYICKREDKWEPCEKDEICERGLVLDETYMILEDDE